MQVGLVMVLRMSEFNAVADIMMQAQRHRRVTKV
jgi:hypothetical protein